MEPVQSSAESLPNPDADRGGISRRAAANRLNARKSTGPRTEAGKERSRRNAVKHGLSGAGVVIPTAIEEAARRKAEAWAGSLAPRNEVERELVGLGATTMTRLDQCWREEAAARGRAAGRAALAWDDDRKVEAERLAGRIGEDPSAVAAELRSTLHGAEWMAGRWRSLDRRLAAGRDLTGPQRVLALDLLGVPPELRDDLSEVDFPGLEPDAAREAVREVVAAQLARLDDAIAGYLADLDESDRLDRASDLPGLSDPEVGLFRRYERALAGRVLSVLSQLRRGVARRDDVAPPPLDETKPNGVHPVAPPPAVETKPNGVQSIAPQIAASPDLSSKRESDCKPSPARECAEHAPADPDAWLRSRSDEEVETVVLPLLMARLREIEARLRLQFGDDPEPS